MDGRKGGVSDWIGVWLGNIGGEREEGNAGKMKTRAKSKRLSDVYRQDHWA